MTAEIIQFVPGLKAKPVDGILELTYADGSTFRHPVIAGRIVHRADEPDAIEGFAADDGDCA